MSSSRSLVSHLAAENKANELMVKTLSELKNGCALHFDFSTSKQEVGQTLLYSKFLNSIVF